MNIITFLSYCVIVTFTPGPTNIVIASIAQNSGINKASKFVLGSTLGFGMLLSISALFNKVLVNILPRVLPIMQVIGCIYILYLAVQILKKGTTSKKHVSGSVPNSYFLEGLLMQFVNPKVVMFTMTVIPSYILPYYSSAKILMIYVCVIAFIGFLAFSMWVMMGVFSKAFLQKQQKAVNIIMALFLFYSAFMVSGLEALL
ncbi:LysE family translocator [Fusibacter paucivorans]|uniref:LysE family translocator n=1 Tax=Fusibacter paucivorans TaxID=76009 RepID=A0ABS5PV67_9FIRM|nr:LysE family translocator [Fusibacter paucivorans]MBS7528526.1 LysE family translocator [Fusibacter paucivorans]